MPHERIIVDRIEIFDLQLDWISLPEHVYAISRGGPGPCMVRRQRCWGFPNRRRTLL